MPGVDYSGLQPEKETGWQRKGHIFESPFYYIEYGLAHVKTPVLVVLGHTRCGAVTAVSQAVGGHGHKLERNIPPLVDNIIPAVKRAMEEHPDLHGEAIVPFAIEENVWQAVEDLFMKSPAVRDLAKSGRVLALANARRNAAQVPVITAGNLAAVEAHDPGSVANAFSVAAAIDEGAVTPTPSRTASPTVTQTPSVQPATLTPL